MGHVELTACAFIAQWHWFFHLAYFTIEDCFKVIRKKVAYIKGRLHILLCLHVFQVSFERLLKAILQLLIVIKWGVKCLCYELAQWNTSFVCLWSTLFNTVGADWRKTFDSSDESILCNLFQSLRSRIRISLVEFVSTLGSNVGGHICEFLWWNLTAPFRITSFEQSTDLRTVLVYNFILDRKMKTKPRQIIGVGLATLLETFLYAWRPVKVVNMSLACFVLVNIIKIPAILSLLLMIKIVLGRSRFWRCLILANRITGHM